MTFEHARISMGLINDCQIIIIKFEKINDDFYKYCPAIGMGMRP